MPVGSAGDFLISRSLSGELTNPEKLSALKAITSAGHFVVIPAFDVNVSPTLKQGLPQDKAFELGIKRAITVSDGTKGQLLSSLLEGWLNPFAFARNNTLGHGPTSYTR